MLVNPNHKLSISRNPDNPQPRIRVGQIALGVLAVVLAAGSSRATAAPSCASELGTPPAKAGSLSTHGTTPATVELTVVPGHTYLIEVTEQGNDALVEIVDTKRGIVARADHPERRTGTRRAVVATDNPALTVRVTGKELASASGTAGVRALDLATLAGRPDCVAIVKVLAGADADYAVAQDLARGRATSAAGSARSAFLHAAAEYSTAETALAVSGDEGLRGETQLALAGLEYHDLQDWAQSVDWARAAAESLGSADAYRRARAEALIVLAWIEIGWSAPPGGIIPGYGVSATELLSRARTLAQRLSRFHQARGESHDAGLQLTSVGNTYYGQGRYPECATADMQASRLFDEIHETPRRGQAWQNAALCLWGLGRLPEALVLFKRSLPDIGPDPYPILYVAALTNTALADYALGHLDESLELFDRALTFTNKIQAPRDQAYCLYGIGVDYYALGDRERAREFLERSLAIRTPALDGRGRGDSLRALANIDAEQGRFESALAFDREALSLAISAPAIPRIRIQLAVHTAASGNLGEAKAQLDEVIGQTKTDPLIQAEALLQRAVVLRKMGEPRAALADLSIARPRLGILGGVTQAFTADLETARALRLLGDPQAALAAVDRALAQADAVRLQSANPELRAQLQTPLRPAYDLKLELLREYFEHALASGRQADASRLAAEAFATADASRARSFADVAAQRYSPAVRRTLAAEFRRREELYRELAARRFALDARLDRSGSGNPAGQHLISDIAELEREVDTVNTRIAAQTLPGAVSVRVGTVRALPAVPSDTAIVSYWLGSDSAYAWVVSPTAIQWVRLSAPAQIGERAAAFHRSLRRLVDVPVEQRLQDGRVLYDLVLRPLESWLSGVTQWVVIPDGALDYVPFAALSTSDAEPNAFVAVQHDVAFTPAAWMLNLGVTHTPPKDRRELLLVADPVYQSDDPRLVGVNRAAQPLPVARTADPGSREFQRLPFSGQEAVQIRAQFSPADVDALIGLDATRERLLSMDWSRYRYIHIVAHGIVDAQVPQLSALVLGSYDTQGERVDGDVRVADLSLETLHADVAVFSACDTALGKQVPSEGLVGISFTTLARGAQAVVASLWPVSDEIGARLMTDFYQYLRHDSMSAPAALGAAMRSVILRDRNADPALWAAFQVSVVAIGPGLPNNNAKTAKVAITHRPEESP